MNLSADAALQREAMETFVQAVLEEVGPRESCSEAERKLGERLADTWATAGFSVRRERFTCHPGAFLGAIRVAVVLNLIAVVLYSVSPIAAAVVGAIGAALAFFETLNYREILDRLYPLSSGENVSAVIKPRGPIQRRVLVNAHMDSAYEFSLWYLFKERAVIVMILGALAMAVPVVGGLAATTGVGGDTAVSVLGWASLSLSPVVAAHFFFRSNQVVPGAGDDLAGIGVLVGLGRMITGGFGLDSTEIVLLGTSAEEAGLRGAKRYVEAHAEEIRSTPTFAIVVDGVYDEAHLRAVSAEVLAFARHDRALIELAKQSAAASGTSLGECVIPLGASDAAALARGGVRTVALLCQDTTRLIPNYHTRHDTFDRVSPGAMPAMLAVVAGMLRALDAPGK